MMAERSGRVSDAGLDNLKGLFWAVMNALEQLPAEQEAVLSYYLEEAPHCVITARMGRTTKAVAMLGSTFDDFDAERGELAMHTGPRGPTVADDHAGQHLKRKKSHQRAGQPRGCQLSFPKPLLSFDAINLFTIILKLLPECYTRHGIGRLRFRWLSPGC